MMKRLIIYAVWGVVLSGGVLISDMEARAGDACHYGLTHYPYLWSIVHTGVRDMPYYAAYPPVYYSQVIPRPYGYCPYAYLPGVVSRESLVMPLAARAESVRNGPVSIEAMSEPEPRRAVATPLRITNPYVAQPAGAEAGETGRIASRRQRQPQVVFPMAAADKP